MKDRKKILFILAPTVLAAITSIWLFYKDGRWYTYRDEWPFGPLLVLHLLFPLFYLSVLVVTTMRHVNKKTREKTDVFYTVSSIIMTVVCCLGLLAFLIFTSGM